MSERNKTLFDIIRNIFFPNLYSNNLSNILDIGTKIRSQNNTCFNVGLLVKIALTSDAKKPIESIFSSQ